MKNRSGNIFTALALLALFTLNLPLSTAHAQGTAFTYQGQLQNNGSPANGTYNLTFTLYTNASGGTIVGGPVTNNAVAVTNGLFTVTMDFGAGPWNGQTNWLQIAVKTNGGATFTMLTPLQELTPAPYAIYAESAGTATALAGGTALGSGSGNGIGLGNSDVFIGGGSQNSMSSSSYGFIGGGQNNFMTDSYDSFIGGGWDNFVSGDLATVGGGRNNTANNYYATVGGGWLNTAQGDLDTVGGGAGNFADGSASFIGGGGFDGSTYDGNTIQGNAASIVGGLGNFIYANYAFIGGGIGNTNNGMNGVIPGGYFNFASGSNSFAAGSYAQATNNGAFVWADNENAAFGSTNANSFNVRANGGIRFVTGGAGMAVDGITITGGSLNFPDPVTINSGGNSLLYSSNARLNFFAGLYAGNPANDQGDDNTANGYQALGYNTSGFYNTANGFEALYLNTIGSGNTANGVAALSENTSGSYNIALGYEAGFNITTGSSNIDIGNEGASTDTNIIRIGSSQTATYLAGTIYGAGGSLNFPDPVTINSGGNSLLYSSNARLNFFAGLYAGNPANDQGDDNTANGYQALGYNTSGFYNTANGFEALYLNTIGSGNTANGVAALSENTSGSYNIALGYEAGFNITTGSSNIDIGNEGASTDTNIIRIGSSQTATYLAGTIYGAGGSLNFPDPVTINSGGNSLLYSSNARLNFFAGLYAGNPANDQGDDNTANGYQALGYNTSGFYNTANGFEALYLNTIGSGNTANGVAALSENTSGSYNIALGYEAGFNITTGSSNIDIGNEGVSTDTNIIRIGSSQTQTYIAGVINGVGSGLTSLNAAQVVSTTEGIGNNFLGSAGNATTTGEYNTGSGLNALASNTSGSDNTTTGSGALHANTSGNDNTGYGYNALHANTNGIENTAVGSGALFNNIRGTGNIAIGFNAGDNVTNNSNIDIGNTGVVTDTNIIRIGTSQASTYLVGNVYTPSGTVESSSDRNAKEDFSAVSPQSVLAKVASLPVTEWNYKTDKAVEHIGPMAQDFHAAFGLNGADDKHISVVDEGGVALAAIQGLNQKLEAGSTEQGVQIRNQNAEIQELKQQNDLLEKQLSELEATVKKLVAHE